MANREKETKVEEPGKQKTCFVVSPIGRDGSPERKHAGLFIRHIVKPVLEPLGYEVVRADMIDVAGIISTQIVKHLRHSELVIADLSFHNPNVFYELAIRHIVAKPFIHMVRTEDPLPFDVAPQRAIFFDLQDLDSVAEAKARLESQVREYEKDPNSPSPISEQIRFEALEMSSNGGVGLQLEGLFQEVRSLARRVDARPSRTQDDVENSILTRPKGSLLVKRENGSGFSSGIVNRVYNGISSTIFMIPKLLPDLEIGLTGSPCEWIYGSNRGEGVITEVSEVGGGAHSLISISRQGS